MTLMKLLRQTTLALAIVAVVGVTADAQPGGRGGRGGFGFGGGGFGGFSGLFGGGGDARFALRDDVRKELDLDDDQVEELTDLSRNAPSMRNVMRDLDIDFRSMGRMSSEERAEAMAPLTKKMAKLNDEARKEVVEVLTTKQKARYSELKFQYDISQGRAAAALSSAKIKLDDDDQDELKDAMDEVNAKLQKRIAELRMELYVEALGSVVSKSKVEDLMGDAFAFDAQSGRQGRGRGGAGRGGDAGGRGGRGGGGAGGTNPRRRRPSADDDDDEPANPRRRRRD